MLDLKNYRRIVLRHKVNEGVRIYPPKGHIDILVRKVKGTGRKREGIIDILSGNGESLKNKHITCEYQNLMPTDHVYFNITLGVRTTGSELSFTYYIPKKDLIQGYHLDEIVDMDGKIRLRYPDQSVWLKNQQKQRRILRPKR
ncbi:hypothetical protein GOV12_06865 [Candidatus Pacearchaeota archaeon]|nr:hypothetical protein [Candidatus Pacearchaeota archaeon]